MKYAPYADTPIADIDAPFKTKTEAALFEVNKRQALALEALLVEQRRTNELLTQLVGRRE